MHVRIPPFAAYRPGATIAKLSVTSSRVGRNRSYVPRGREERTDQHYAGDGRGEWCGYFFS
jgi:hypothetical protein